jgi:hypothetical protein
MLSTRPSRSGSLGTGGEPLLGLSILLREMIHSRSSFAPVYVITGKSSSVKLSTCSPIKSLCCCKVQMSLRLQSRNVSVIEGISSQGRTLRVQEFNGTTHRPHRFFANPVTRATVTPVLTLASCITVDLVDCRMMILKQYCYLGKAAMHMTITPASI